MKILTSLLSRQKKPTQEQQPTVASGTDSMSSPSSSDSYQTYIPAASFANSQSSTSASDATASAIATDTAASATASSAHADDVSASAIATDTATAVSTAEKSDSLVAASSSRTAAAMARASAAAARLSASAASRSESDNVSASEAQAASTDDTVATRSTRERGHAFLATLISSNPSTASADFEDTIAGSAKAESEATAGTERLNGAASDASDAASVLAGTTLHSRFERSSNFAPRSTDSLTDLSEIASNRNRGAVHRAAQHMAMINQRSQEASLDETSETLSAPNMSSTASSNDSLSLNASTSSSSVSASNSGTGSWSTASVPSDSVSTESTEAVTSSSSPTKGSGANTESVTASTTASSDSSNPTNEAKAYSESHTDSTTASGDNSNPTNESRASTESHTASTTASGDSSSTTNESDASTESVTASPTPTNSVSGSGDKHETDQEAQAEQSTSSGFEPERGSDSGSLHSSTDEVGTRTENETRASAEDSTKPKHRMTLRKQIKRIRVTEDKPQDSSQGTATTASTTSTTSSNRSLTTKATAIATDAASTLHDGMEAANGSTLSTATASAAGLSSGKTATATSTGADTDVEKNDKLDHRDDAASIGAASEVEASGAVIVVPDDRQRARDERAAIEQLIGEYKIVKLTDWDSDIVPAVAGDKVIKVAHNMEQAVRLCGHNDSDCRNNLSHIDSYVRMCEDRFLGRRYAKNAFFLNNTLEVEESYLGDAFNNSERKEHTILELLQVLASQDAQKPFVASSMNEYGQVEYERHRRSRLRRILFNNPFLNSISYNGNLDDKACWDAWVEQFNNLNSDDPNGQIGPSAKAKFKEHFGNFANFEKAINLMRSWLIDYDSKRQWVTMFLFPFGTNALYKEIDKKYISKNNIFSGQGDIVFSMLQRAANSPYLTATQAQQLQSAANLLESISTSQISSLAVQATTAASSSQDAATSAASAAAETSTASAAAASRAVCAASTAATAAAAEDASSAAATASAAVDVSKDKLDVGEYLVHRFFNDDNMGKNLVHRFFYDNDVINIFAGYINDSELEAADHSGFSTTVKTSYLPYVDLPVFERLKEDFTNLLHCPLNKQKLFIALARMATLNLLVYLLEQEQKMCICYDYSKKALLNGSLAAQLTTSAVADASAAAASASASAPASSVAGAGTTAQAAAGAGAAGAADEVERAMAELAGRYDITMPVCAKGNKDNKDVKRISKERQLFNNGLFDDSRKSFVLHRAELYLQLTVPFLRHKPQLSTEEGNLVKRIICAAFNYNSENEDKSKKKGSSRKKLDWDMRNCSTIIETMLTKALNRETHMSGLNSHLAAQCGLSKPTKTGKANYEMSDELLRTLVMAVLGKEECMKLSRFLDIIRERYHIVIGPTESNRHQSREELENSTDRPNFEANLTQLKLQLHRLDMLINLSDYCEYIRRP